MARADGVIEKITGQDHGGLPPAPPVEIDAPPRMKYHVIKIHPKRHDHDQEVVHVHAGNSKQDWDFRMRRDSLIPVPEAICEVMRNATYPQYQMPTDEELRQGKTEKVVGKIQRFTFDTVFRDIPEDIYMKLKDRAKDPNAKEVTEKEIEAMLASRRS